MGAILLCSHRENLLHPASLGLGDVALDGLAWLVCESAADAARAAAAEKPIDEVWIEGCEDMDALNLAAAIRADDGAVPIVVVVPEATGSLRSRAQAAGVSDLVGSDGLARRFSVEKERRGRMEEAAAGLEAALDAALAAHSREAVLGQVEQRGPDPLRIPERPAAAVPEAAVPAGSPGAERPRRAAAASVLTVLSGSGGAGKSTVAVVAAEAAAAKGHRVLLFDCDLQFGDAAYLCGAAAPVTADDVLADPERLERLAQDAGPSGLALLGAPPRLEQAEVVAANLPRILDAASGLFDAIVVNTGASWAEYHATLIERSDCALFIVDQKASSVRACRHAVELCERMGIATANFEYAVNRCGRGALFTSIDVSCALQGVRVFELKDGGADVEELLGAGQAAELLQMRNDLCISVSAMLDELLPEARSSRTSTAVSPKGRTPRRRKRKGAPAGAKPRRDDAARAAKAVAR